MSSFHDVFNTENRARGFPGILKGSEKLGKNREKPTKSEKIWKNAEKS